MGLSTDKWKRTVDDYVTSSCSLFMSMSEDGFRHDCAVPVDPNGELLDGSHRVACAVALGIESIPVIHKPHYVWAPPWGFSWFAAHGMLFSTADLDRLMMDWGTMRQ